MFRLTIEMQNQVLNKIICKSNLGSNKAELCLYICFANIQELSYSFCTFLDILCVCNASKDDLKRHSTRKNKDLWKVVFSLGFIFFQKCLCVSYFAFFL